MTNRLLPIQKIKKSDVCAEVGVWRGDYSSEILKCQPKKLYLIDPWVHQDYPWVEWAKGQRIIDAYNHVENKFKNQSNVSIQRKNSTDVYFGKEYLDWVYLDADHSYDSVLNDLKHWYPQIKKGGFLCGDDYGWSHELTKGPQPAVDEFVELNNLKIEIEHTQFVIHI